MKCPHCKKDVEYMDDVRTGRATVTYRLDRDGNRTHEELNDLENEENFGCFCPHCDKEFDEDFIEQFLRER